MSYTKALKKKLPNMTQTDKECLLFALCRLIEKEKNPCVRSSLNERIAMLKPHVTEQQWELSKPSK